MLNTNYRNEIGISQNVTLNARIVTTDVCARTLITIFATSFTNPNESLRMYEDRDRANMIKAVPGTCKLLKSYEVRIIDLPTKVGKDGA